MQDIEWAKEKDSKHVIRLKSEELKDEFITFSNPLPLIIPSFFDFSIKVLSSKSISGNPLFMGRL